MVGPRNLNLRLRRNFYTITSAFKTGAHALGQPQNCNAKVCIWNATMDPEDKNDLEDPMSHGQTVRFCFFTSEEYMVCLSLGVPQVAKRRHNLQTPKPYYFIVNTIVAT